MRLISRVVFFILVISLVGGCSSASLQGVPVAAAPPQNTSQPTYVLAPPNATPTPTPFQPLAPTPAGGIAAPASPPVSQPVASPTVAPPAPAVNSTPQAVIPVEGFQEVQPLAQLPKQMNILLLGSDKRPWEGGFRTDTIILVTVNAELGRVNITSFPRDLYLTLPGWGMSRINTAWTYGGHKLLYATMQHNFGITIDHYVLINFSSFKQIVDDLGGLTVQVGEPLADYRYGYWTKIPAGEVHMDADTVLWYVRSRKTTNDFERNRRQQEVLAALFEKMLSLNAIRRAPEFWQLYQQNVKTDLNFMDLLVWLPLAAKMAETREIHQYYIGPKQVSDWITPEGAMVLLPDQQAVMNIIQKSQNLK